VKLASKAVELDLGTAQKVIQIAEVDVEGRLGYSGLARDAAGGQLPAAFARQGAARLQSDRV
jgi:hypothetical protein